MRKAAITAVLFCISLSFCHNASALDTLVAKGKTHTGIFLKFRRNRFHFQLLDGKRFSEAKSDVTSLKLSPPANSYVKPFGEPLTDFVKFAGYENKIFSFTKKDEKLSYKKVIKIGMVTDTKRDKQHKLDISGGPKPGEAITTAERGPITIIHFHLKISEQSIRCNSHINKKIKTIKKGQKVKFITNKFRNMKDPELLKIGMTKLPQVWVFDRYGKIHQKFIQKISFKALDKAIDGAVKKY